MSPRLLRPAPQRIFTPRLPRVTRLLAILPRTHLLLIRRPTRPQIHQLTRLRTLRLRQLK